MKMTIIIKTSTKIRLQVLDLPFCYILFNQSFSKYENVIFLFIFIMVIDDDDDDHTYGPSEWMYIQYLTA